MRETITGVAKGITEDGVLLLEDHEGKVHHIHSADIELSKRSSSFELLFISILIKSLIFKFYFKRSSS